MRLTYSIPSTYKLMKRPISYQSYVYLSLESDYKDRDCIYWLELEVGLKTTNFFLCCLEQLKLNHV
jgi:hypothetical protein